MKYQYFALLGKAEEGGFNVSFPEIEGAVTCGDDLDESLFNAQECLSLFLEELICNDLEIPKPKMHKGNHFYLVTPDIDIQLALLIKEAKTINNLTTADLARALDTSWASLNRIEKPGSNPTIKQIRKVAAAFGKKPIIEFG